LNEGGEQLAHALAEEIVGIVDHLATGSGGKEHRGGIEDHGGIKHCDDKEPREGGENG
jgi:hypothetical protein